MQMDPFDEEEDDDDLDEDYEGELSVYARKTNDSFMYNI